MIIIFTLNQVSLRYVKIMLTLARLVWVFILLPQNCIIVKVHVALQNFYYYLLLYQSFEFSSQLIIKCLSCRCQYEIPVTFNIDPQYQTFLKKKVACTKNDNVPVSCILKLLVVKLGLLRATKTHFFRGFIISK